MFFVKADVQLTQYAVKDDYSAHDCTQLLPCGSMETLGVQGKSECALQALHKGTDMFSYEEEDKSCHLGLQDFAGGGVTEVPSCQLVFVKGLKICIIQSQILLRQK